MFNLGQGALANRLLRQLRLERARDRRRPVFQGTLQKLNDRLVGSCRVDVFDDELRHTQPEVSSHLLYGVLQLRAELLHVGEELDAVLRGLEIRRLHAPLKADEREGVGGGPEAKGSAVAAVTAGGGGAGGDGGGGGSGGGGWWGWG